jgi:hypothetical protein
MELEPLELRDHRYRAQQALGRLKNEDQAEERQALEAKIAHFQEICLHEHAEEVAGEWRCRDCDLRKTTAVPEPVPEPEPEPVAAEEAPAEVAAAPAEEAPAAAEPAAEAEPEKPAEG